MTHKPYTLANDKSKKKNLEMLSLNYYHDRVLHLFANVPKQIQLFTEILISKESFLFPTRCGINRFTSTGQARKGEKGGQIYTLILQIP